MNKERQLGRRDIVTDTDNRFVYQPREVRRLRKQQTHTVVVGTRAANGRFRGAQAPEETYLYTESRTKHQRGRSNHTLTLLHLGA